MDRIKQRLTVNNSKGSVNKDVNVKLEFINNERVLPVGEINKIVNLADRFQVERNRSSLFRFISTFDVVSTNALFNTNDIPTLSGTTWAHFNNMLFLDQSYPKDNTLFDKTDLTYSQSISKYLIEKDGWFGFTNPNIIGSGLCDFIDMEPKRERFSVIPDIHPYGSNPLTTTSVNNWEITMTYPYSSDKTHEMVSGGLLIIDKVSVTVSNRNMTAIGLACKHNLKRGDVVKIYGTTGQNGEHVVIRTGLDNGDLKDFYFVIDVLPTGTINNSSRIKKVINSVECEYYFRLFRKIKTKDSPIIKNFDYEAYRLGFSQNIYTDDLSQSIFNEDINIEGLLDNLGRPVSEVFLTIIKTDSNLLFTKVTSGIETPFIPTLINSAQNANTYLQKIPAINMIHNGGNLPFPSHQPLEDPVSINNTQFFGDIV